MTTTFRGTGNTTSQIKAAPIGAAFIWCREQTDYPELLALELGRTDLKFLPISVLKDENIDKMRGMSYSAIIVDHGAVLTPDQKKGLQRLSVYCARN